MVVVLHEARHERQVEFRPLAARIGQGVDDHVDLSARQRVVLLAGAEQRLRRVDGDLEVHIRGRDLVGDDLGHLVTDVAGRPLVRQPQFGLRGDGTGGEDPERRDGGACPEFHGFPPLG